MKHLVLLSLSLAITTSVSAQNYFNVEGTQWNVAYYSCDPTDSSERAVQFSLEGSYSFAGRDCLQYWCTDLDRPGSRHLIGYVYTEGEKVYFLYPECVDDEPLLVYDFDLILNDTVTVFRIKEAYYSDYYPSSVQKCSGVSQINSYEQTYEILEMCELLPDGSEPSYAHQHGQWIKGIGGVYFQGGVFGNSLYNVDGGNAILYSVVVNGETIYHNNNAVVSNAHLSLPESAITYHLDGTIQKQAARGLQIHNGQVKLIR